MEKEVTEEAGLGSCLMALELGRPPSLQLGTLGRFGGLPHICPLLHGVLQGLGLLFIHLDIVYLLI